MASSRCVVGCLGIFIVVLISRTIRDSGICCVSHSLGFPNVLAVVLVSFLQHAAGLGLSSLSMQYASMLFVMTSLAGLLSRRRRHGQTQQPAATAMG